MKRTRYSAAVAAVLLAASIGVAQARSAVPLIEHERVPLVSGQQALTPDLVKQALIRGGARHSWTVVDDEPGKLRLKVNKRNENEVVVEVTYDATGYLIRYVSSFGMMYADEKGVPVIHPFYNKWIDNLIRATNLEASTALAQPPAN